MPDKTEVVTTERAIAYFYKDSNLGEPFPVYEARAGTWWMDGGTNLHNLISRFKMHDTVKQACYITGISYDQYRQFKDIHPWFVPAIRVYRSLPAAKIKDIILEAAIGNEAKGIKPSAKIALGAYRIFDEPEDDPDFVVQKLSALPIPEGGSLASLIQEAYMDKDGNVLMKRSTAQLLEEVKHTEEI